MNDKVLLLNVSNMEAFPVFPYAFIQVTAVARRAGVGVVCRDFLGLASSQWSQAVKELIQQHQPAIVLVTLRNTDSLSANDYNSQKINNKHTPVYFPVKDTKKLIQAIRKVSDLKIAVGGFGFSLLAAELMPILQPDLGVFGGADSFFAEFENIKSGPYTRIPNLLYYHNGDLIQNKRVFYPPLNEPEYHPETIRQMLAFYERFPNPGFQGAPVEIMRGCSYTCVFCSEPHVKGNQVHYRPLGIIMKDIESLVEHGITSIYIVSSELNPEGNDFVLELADNITEFNKTQANERKVTWFGANYLLAFEKDDYDRLEKSGFTGGWFDLTALDDDNARAMRTPYRNKYVLPYLQTYAQHKRKRIENTEEKPSPLHWTIFLGNPAATIQTIRNTLRAANQHGIPQLFDSCGIIFPIRVFDYEEPDANTLAVTFSIDESLERVPYHQVLPSFAYPPALLDHFGSEAAVSQMFAYISETYLSIHFEQTRHWHRFLQNHTAPDAIASWLERRKLLNQSTKEPATWTGQEIKNLFDSNCQTSENNPKEKLARQIVDSFLEGYAPSFRDLLMQLSIPAGMGSLSTLKPYDIAVQVYQQWWDMDRMTSELIDDLPPTPGNPPRELAIFWVQVLMHRFNIILKPEFKPLFVETV